MTNNNDIASQRFSIPKSAFENIDIDKKTESPINIICEMVITNTTENIKKALQVKRLSPITDRFKLITLMKLQKMEYKK